MSFGQKIAACFLHNLAMAIAFQQVGTYESTGIFVYFYKMSTHVSIIEFETYFQQSVVALTIVLPPGNV